jgi:DEAD/DEAH box helicase domain-containing protein
VSVVEKVVGYKKIKFYTHENAGYGDVRLPEMQMHTTAFWLTVPEATCQSMTCGRAAAIDGLRGLGRALETVATLALMCDPRDLGATLGDTDLAPEADAVPRKVRGGPKPGYSPTLFLYEHTPGGIGLAERIFAQREVLLVRALRLIEGCPCSSGCPACVGRRRRGRKRQGREETPRSHGPQGNHARARPPRPAKHPRARVVCRLRPARTASHRGGR